MPAPKKSDQPSAANGGEAFEPSLKNIPKLVEEANRVKELTQLLGELRASGRSR